MYSQQEKGKGRESLQTVRARLLPPKRQDLERLIWLDADVRNRGSELITRQQAVEIGRLRGELSSEVGGEAILDQILGEAHAEYLAEGVRNSQARRAHEANRPV